MLKREEAEKRLAEFVQPGWVEKHAGALRKLPQAGAWMRLRLGDGERSEEELRRKSKGFRVSSLSDAERREFFQTLFPKMADVVERAWQERGKGPYVFSIWQPRPFRAPGHAATVNQQRDQWFQWMLDELKGHNPDPAWIATWGGHMGYGGIGQSSRLLAAAMDMGGKTGDEVFEILKQSASNQHEIGVMGNHVVHALLQCGREDAWEFMVKLLLAAQRQEGLRQSILEAVQVAHPGAFRRMLRVIAEENLVRFAATVRAIDVWFGFMWDSMSTGHAQSIIERVIALMDDGKARSAAIAGKDAETAYLALWCEAHADAEVAAKSAAALLTEKSPEKRWVGVHAMGMIGLPEVIAPVSRALADEDIRVAARALDALRSGITEHYDGADGLLDGGDEDDEGEDRPSKAPADLFVLLENLLKRIKGKEEKFKPLVFPWARSRLGAEEVGSALVRNCPPERGERLVGMLDRFDALARSSAAWLIAGNKVSYFGYTRDKQKLKKLTPLARTTLVSMLGDAAKDVRTTAGFLLEQEPITGDEAARHEELLDRTASDVRTRAVMRLLTLPDDGALVAAQRLLRASKPCVLAGLEILRALVEQNRSADAARAAAVAFGDAAKKPSKEVQIAIEAIRTRTSSAPISASDAFGLAQTFAPRALPKIRAIAHDEPTAAAVACIWSLNDLVEAHKTFEIKAIDDDGDEVNSSGEERLLGSLRWAGRASPSRWLTREKDKERCPVLSILEPWLGARGADMRDRDGLELVRAWLLLQQIEEDYSKTTWPAAIGSLAPKGKSGKPAFKEGIELLLDWALRLSDTDAMTFCLDQLEGAIERADIYREEDNGYSRKKTSKHAGFSLRKWLEHYRGCPANWTRLDDLAHLRRLDGLVRAASEVLEGQLAAKHKKRDAQEDDSDDEDAPPFIEIELEEFVALWSAGELSDDELMVRITRPNRRTRYSYGSKVEGLSRLIARRMPGKKDRWERLTLTPRLDAILEKIRLRVLEIELARGDAETPATPHAFSLDPSGGIDAAIPALAGLGKLKLVRGYIYQNQSKAATFSTLIQHSRPSAADTPEAFAAAAKSASLSDERLVELALYQPRWAAHVERATGWAGLEEGVLWLRAHVKEVKYSFDDGQQEAWEARAAELTPIPSDSLADGAVDRAWFERCYKRLGAKRWEVLYDAAKYASSGSGHTRARLFADAMLGEVSEKELTTRIKGKRHQDAARALGLLEIKAGDAGKKQVLARFKVLQEMRRTSRKHGGSMLQASEKRAVEIGMENLAWTAGYPDPLRLQWAMEIEEFGDLAKGPVVVKVGDTTVTLAVDDDGKPALNAAKGGKPLKSVPPVIKKDKRIAPLAERVGELRRQGTRIRRALEQAMCRGDEFAGSEIVTLFGHPLLKSLLGRLVMIGTTKAGGALIGYPDKGGKALRSFDGRLEPIKASDALRIAHPLDLLATKRWHDWQAECFKAERVQPFRQVFREVYTPIASETEKGSKTGGHASVRYAGQQVQPRQALALFGTRGWVARPEEGVQRTFHTERVTVRVEFEEGFYTPAEIDGLTLAGASFAKAGTHEPLAIRDVPSRIFSEIMRDLDLVVSVAHRGGVDPEASQSTVEMRGALLRETCSLLSLDNVRLEKSRAVIKGDLGEYALHLGSGTIHKLPGGTLWIIPVHSQHRGRVFLPFADDDPKTAEIISKALLLARDKDIQDPAVLAQIRAG